MSRMVREYNAMKHRRWIADAGVLLSWEQVFVDPLTPGDLLYIAANKFPLLAAPSALPSSSSLLSRMIAFNRLVTSCKIWGTC